MKTVLVLAAFCCSIVSAQEWKLVWADEFDRPGLPDDAIWGYESGFVRNKEKQYYTVKRAENVRIENGQLVITARKENYEGKADCTSGSINTLGRKSFLYGRIEVRAQLPKGQGCWPAIWMMGTNIFAGAGWPKCGEIDIMEHVWAHSNTVHSTMHWYDPAKVNANGNFHRSHGGKLKEVVPYDGFHIYAAEWDREQIRFFYDGRCYFTFNVNEAGEGDGNPFRKPQYLLLNLAIGGGWGGAVDDSIFPAEYRIDYVRYYRK